MSQVSRRYWRLFCCTLTIAVCVAPVEAQTVTLTTISEVRWSDAGWGPYNDQNFTTQTFTLPRLAKVQGYFLRQFDASTPQKYSRFSAALHIDYPY